MLTLIMVTTTGPNGSVPLVEPIGYFGQDYAVCKAAEYQPAAGCQMTSDSQPLLRCLPKSSPELAALQARIANIKRGDFDENGAVTANDATAFYKAWGEAN